MSNVSTQFKKGQTGNPNGRPKRDWTWAGLLEDAMEEEDEEGVPYKLLIGKKLRSLASKGDMVAAKEILNRMDGMPTQDIKQTGSVTMNVKIVREKVEDGK